MHRDTMSDVWLYLEKISFVPKSDNYWVNANNKIIPSKSMQELFHTGGVVPFKPMLDGTDSGIV